MTSKWRWRCLPCDFWSLNQTMWQMKYSKTMTLPHSLSFGFILIVLPFSVLCYIYIPATTHFYHQPQHHNWISCFSLETERPWRVFLSSPELRFIELHHLRCVFDMNKLPRSYSNGVQKSWIKETKNRCCLSPGKWFSVLWLLSFQEDFELKKQTNMEIKENILLTNPAMNKSIS